MNEIENALHALKAAKAAKLEAETQIEDAQALLIKIAERDEVKTLSGTVDGQTVNATVVAVERLSYDEKALKKALGDKWKTIRTEKVDATKLKTAIIKGEVDAMEVAKHTTIQKSKPYLRLSVGDTTQQRDS